jgi:hypothetical protein
MTAPPAFPAPKDDDDDDVAWALSTALVQWKRGSPPDAIVWLRRAIDSAVAVGATWRAAELTRQTDELEAHWAAVQANAQPVVSSARPVTIDEIEIIGDDALSLPPDASMSELPPPPSAGFRDAEVTVRDDHVATQLDEDDAEIETSEEEEVLELNDDEISEEADEAPADIDEEIGDDDLGDHAPRFDSEAPTGMLRAPMFAPPAAELEHTEPEPDSSPTHARFNLTEELGPVEPAHEAAPTAEPSEAAGPVEEAAPEEPYVAGVSLAEISGFEDFPPDMQVRLAKAARVERLATEEEVSGFGLALVLRGAVSVMPTIADVTCGVAQERELVYGKGTIADGVQLRLVAAAPDTQVATWDFEIIAPALSACPWVLADLQAVADRYQALAGVSMGPMGDRLDDSLRAMVLSRCRLLKLSPGEQLVEKGKPIGGLFIVGAGHIEVGPEPASASTEKLGPGDFLFAQQILAGGVAPASARAAASGALVMAADRLAAHELLVSVPPLLELLAG